MQSDNPILTETAPIPVRASVIAAVRMVQNEWKTILQILLIPSFILAVLAIAFKPEQIPGEPESINLVHGFAGIFVQAWLAVALLRFLALGEKPQTWLAPYQPRMWKYMWRQFLVTLATFVPVAIAAVVLVAILPRPVAIVSVLIFTLVATLVATRLSLVAPATATGADNFLTTSWRRTRGQIFRIALIRFVLAVLAVLPVIAIVLISVVVQQASKPAAFMISMWGVTIIQIAALQIIDAVIYAHFFQGTQPRDE